MKERAQTALTAIPDPKYGMLREIGRWCCVEERPPTGKTRRFLVTDAGGNPLGDVKWFSAWRRYAFYPGRLTVYEPTCLRDIATFIDGLMAERKAMAALRRATHVCDYSRTKCDAAGAFVCLNDDDPRCPDHSA